MKSQYIVLMALSLAAAGCGSKKESVAVAENTNAPAIVAAPTLGSPVVSAIPKAVVYKISGNATAANVPVQVSPDDSGKIISFPAPADVRGQEPLQMADGYLLDRRGISANSVFTKWTYAEYSALDQTPTIAEIKDAIIPGARPTQIHVLPMTLGEALSDTAAVNLLISKF